LECLETLDQCNVMLVRHGVRDVTLVTEKAVDMSYVTFDTATPPRLTSDYLPKR
jgi:hypothetical protein